jgi:hypothetical protein
VNTSRFSNIFSKISTVPSDCVASASAIEVRSADDELLAARDDDVVAVELGAQPQALEHQPDHAQVVGHAVGDPQLAAGHPGQRHERRDLDVIGRDPVLAAAELGEAVDVHHVGADPLDRRSHARQQPCQVLHVRLRGRVADDRGAGRQGGRHQRVLGAHHRRLVHEEIACP